jgi:hypothetical protein
VASGFKKLILASGTVGSSIAVAFLLIYRVLEQFPATQRRFQFALNDIRFYMWPSSILMMATEGIEGSLHAYLFVTIAVLANGLLYALLGVASWAFYRSMRNLGRKSQRVKN